MYIRNLLYKILLYCITLSLIYPLSPIIFKRFISRKENRFTPPLRLENGVVIRSDMIGDGRFNASRSGGRRRHSGLDIVAKIGEPVFAAKSGIATTGEVVLGMGKYVKVIHPDGYITIYGHLSSIDVADKDWVWQGQRVGEVGKSGNANNPRIEAHLHFEIRRDGLTHDPSALLGISDKNK